MSRKIHNIQFYLPKPRAIYHMSLHHSKEKLAVARIDASIEIWNISKAPFVETQIPHDITNNSIEGLAWCKDRLFSVSLEGLLVEYDLLELKYKNKLTVTGQCAFCLDVNDAQSQIAIGTEQGYINMFSVHDEVLFEKFLDKQEGKVLCLKYHPNGKFIVSGSIDFIRIWNVHTGHAIHKMSIGRATAQNSTIVWCLAIANDFTIISGDSRGKLTFWDGENGSQIESFHTHKADILALSLSDDQKDLYCAGVDTNITCYSKIHVKDDAHKWVKNVQRRLQDHDVRALIHKDDCIYSGGVDGYLICVSLRAKMHVKYPPIMQAPIASVCKSARIIMFRYPTHLEVWSLREAGNHERKLDAQPKRLLVVTSNVKLNGYEGREGMLCSAISDDGNWIAYCTHSKLSVLKFSFDLLKATASVCRIKNLPEECDVAVQITFTPFSGQLIAAQRNGDIVVLKCAEDSVELDQVITRKSHKDVIRMLSTSPDGKYLLVADAGRNVSIYSHENDRWKLHCQLPKYDGAITAFAVQPKKSSLVVAYNDHKIIEYDIKEKAFTDFSKTISNHTIQFGEDKFKHPVRRILFDPHEVNKILLHVGSEIYVLNKDKANDATATKLRKLNDASAKTEKGNKKMSNLLIHKTIRKYDILAYFDNLSMDEYVAVEVPHIKLMEQLPPCLKQFKFGAK